ncbi:MAG: Tad domain-containing protein [Nitrospira sp.]|nr:Tad domain-containing protein [Nitrospira sp.]
MLPFLAIVVIGCLALGGLVIDLGMAILTQVQMQAMADPAALEGLRFRDALDGNGQPIGDEGRRAAAARLASLVFDDDLDPSAPPTMSLRIGAGPELVLTDHDDPTIAALHASRTITVPDQRTYLPQLQLNLTNEPYGDLVAGTFVSPWPTALSREDGNYGRNDFIPSEQADSAGAPAFLVRLRRANDFEGFDHQEGVSSGGSPLPLLAGHGSLTPFANPDNPNDYNFRAYGFTVRATALADVRPALQVGFPQTGVTPPIEGALPLALTLELWNGLPVGQPVVLAVDGTGTISGNGLALAGRFTPPPPDPNAATTVGQAVVAAPPALDAEVTGYVPIYHVFDEGGVPVERVIGFGRAAVTGPLPTVTVTRMSGMVAPMNASRHIRGTVPLPQDSTVWQAVFEANRGLADAVLAPVLVR